MPPIAYLATAGLRILACLSGKPLNKSTVFSCKIIMKCFCVYGIAIALLWLPREMFLHSRAKTFVNALVNKFQSVNNNFDNTLNSLRPMELLAEK